MSITAAWRRFILYILVRLEHFRLRGGGGAWRRGGDNFDARALADLALNMYVSTEQDQPFLQANQAEAFAALFSFRGFPVKAAAAVFDDKVDAFILVVKTDPCLFGVGMFDYVEQQLPHRLEKKHAHRSFASFADALVSMCTARP